MGYTQNYTKNSNANNQPNYKKNFDNGAVNPYNFVRVETINDVERKEITIGEYTGVIHCRLYTTTPLSIPDLPYAKKEKINVNGIQQEHTVSEFYKVNNIPTIPGSEIRGVIRSAYETLSNSCFSVNNNNILSARSADVRKPGVIRYEPDGHWHLYKAEAYKIKKSDDFSEIADTFKRKWLNFEYIDGKAKYKNGKKEVVYKFVTSFEVVNDLFDGETIDSAVADYIEVCEIYKNNKNEQNLKKYIPVIKKKPEYGTCQPLYYLEKDNHLYLSPAQISRSVFHRKVDDLLKSYAHCTDTENLCEACALFGMIGQTRKKNQPMAIASRIRFTDAKLQGEPKYETATLKELSSPKISSVEFYSTARNMKQLWTYDTATKLNGRKFYFHSDRGEYRTSEKTNRNMTTQLVDEGSQFDFDVYFDRITENELHKLLWTLSIGKNEKEGIQQHKIGHGKPLGLGSVKIVVNSVERRTWDKIKSEYSVDPINADIYISENPFSEKATYFKDYMKITNFNYLNGQKMAYPYGDDGKGSKTSKGTLVWFKANHNDGKMVKSGESCPISCHLPSFSDPRLILPAFEKNDNNNNPKNGNNCGGKR